MHRPLIVAIAAIVPWLSSDERALGSEDFRDMAFITAAVQYALENLRSERPFEWSNPDTGNAGIIVVERTFYLDPTTPCREYRRTTARETGGELSIYGTGCRNAEGDWRLNERDTPLPEEEPPLSTTSSDLPETEGERAEAPEPPPAEGRSGPIGRSGPPVRSGRSPALAEAELEPAAEPREERTEETPPEETYVAAATITGVGEDAAREEARDDDTAALAALPPLPRPRPAVIFFNPRLPSRSEE